MQQPKKIIWSIIFDNDVCSSCVLSLDVADLTKEDKNPTKILLMYIYQISNRVYAQETNPIK